MFTSTVKYLGNLRTEAIHERSGNSFITDAPLDNNGKGAYFSPTDTLATALATCMITVMGIRAEKSGFALGAVNASIQKVMANDPRRVIAIEVKLVFDEPYTEKEQAILKHAALNCPVALSLHSEIRQEVDFNFEGKT